jgi:hypothetical protein
MAIAALPYLQIVSAAGAGLTALKLFRAKLHLTYRWFLLFLLVVTVATPVSLFLDQGSIAYLRYYQLVQPVMWIFYVGIVIELYRHIFQRHKGFYSIGRLTVIVSVALSVAVSAAMMFSKIKPEMPQLSKTLYYYDAVTRGIDLALAACLFLMLVGMAFYTVPLSRNLRLHSALFTCFFISSTLTTLLRNVFGLKYIVALDAALLAVSCVCLFSWSMLLSREGETVRNPAAGWFGPQDEERILEKLDALNAAVLRAGGK